MMAALLGPARWLKLQALHQRRTFHPNQGYVEPLNLYTCPSMESGSRKTAVVSRMIAPVAEYERLETERIKPVRALAMSQYLTIAARIDRLRKAGAKNEDQRQVMQEIQALEKKTLPRVPAFPRLFSDDVTPERLAGMMASGTRGTDSGVFWMKGVFSTYWPVDIRRVAGISTYG